MTSTKAVVGFLGSVLLGKFFFFFSSPTSYSAYVSCCKYITMKQLNERFKQFTLSVYVSKYSAQYSGTNGYFRIHVCIILSHDTLGALWVQHN